MKITYIEELQSIVDYARKNGLKYVEFDMGMSHNNVTIVSAKKALSRESVLIINLLEV